jgi:hypothetical protein
MHLLHFRVFPFQLDLQRLCVALPDVQQRHLLLPLALTSPRPAFCACVYYMYKYAIPRYKEELHAYMACAIMYVCMLQRTYICYDTCIIDTHLIPAGPWPFRSARRETALQVTKVASVCIVLYVCTEIHMHVFMQPFEAVHVWRVILLRTTISFTCVCAAHRRACIYTDAYVTSNHATHFLQTTWSDAPFQIYIHTSFISKAHSCTYCTHAYTIASHAHIYIHTQAYLSFRCPLREFDFIIPASSLHLPCVRMHICMCAHMSVCTYVCMHICMYAHM